MRLPIPMTLEINWNAAALRRMQCVSTPLGFDCRGRYTGGVKVHGTSRDSTT